MSEAMDQENVSDVEEIKGDDENTEKIHLETMETVENEKEDFMENEDKGNQKTSFEDTKRICEDEPLWRFFMKSFVEKVEKLEEDDKLNRRKAAVLPRFPNVKSSEQIPPSTSYPCFPLNTFNLKDWVGLPDKLKPKEKVRLWKNLKNDPSVDTNNFHTEILRKDSKSDVEIWPKLYPCIGENLTEECRKLERNRKRKLKGLLPCQDDSDEESNPDEPEHDFADRKELGHARVPITCRSIKKSCLVDRAAGEHPGLVDGDYVVFLFDSKGNDEGNRAYAQVCLRGLKGMHLVELGCKRVREKTWKFCFYQAIVALLAKTQLRYKFAQSVNIDYIFDHAWMLFVHMGSINVKDGIRFDDVIVYNYKYSVELELVQEIKDIPKVDQVGFYYREKNLRKIMELERPELMKKPDVIGWEKPKFPKPSPVHKSTKKIEEWFDKLPDIYRNCVFRTNKFSLAFWKDGFFWYLYNPYRCDEFGFWSDQGFACLLKFCTRNSLKRHLMILLLRAYSYEPKSPLKINKTNDDGKRIDENEDKVTRDNVFSIQIYQMIYHCVQIHNIKLLQRKPPNPRMEKVLKKNNDECTFQSLISSDQNKIDDFTTEFQVNEDEEMNNIEKVGWLKEFKVTWQRYAVSKKRNLKDEPQESKKQRWHHFYVEEPCKIFSLWGEIHPTQQIFDKNNRGKQIYACYVISAGMTMIQAPEYWNSKTLDAIVMCGDRYYTISKLESETALKNDESWNSAFWDKYLSRYFKIGETLFEGNVLEPISGRLYTRKSKNLWRTIQLMFAEYHFGILTCESSCLGIFKFCGAYYMLDVNSVGPPLFQYGDGVTYLIRATSFSKFIRILIVTIGSSECSQFSLNPIKIGKAIDLDKMNKKRDEEMKPKLKKFQCPKEDASKKTNRWKSKIRSHKNEKIDQICCKKI